MGLGERFRLEFSRSEVVTGHVICISNTPPSWFWCRWFTDHSCEAEFCLVLHVYCIFSISLSGSWEFGVKNWGQCLWLVLRNLVLNELLLSLTSPMVAIHGWWILFRCVSSFLLASLLSFSYLFIFSYLYLFLFNFFSYIYQEKFSQHLDVWRDSLQHEVIVPGLIF